MAQAAACGGEPGVVLVMLAVIRSLEPWKYGSRLSWSALRCLGSDRWPIGRATDDPSSACRSRSLRGTPLEEQDMKVALSMMAFSM
jgi:hypothetical protein